MLSNDLPDINNNLKSCLLTDSTNENNKAIKIIQQLNKTHTMNSFTDTATTRLMLNKGQNVGFSAFNNPSSSYYGTVQLWSNVAAATYGTITIYGIDDSYNEISETISLNVANNITPVTSVNSYRWINKMKPTTRGNATSTELYCAISTSATYLLCVTTYYQDLNPCFMVPTGYIARLSSIDNYGGTAVNTISLLYWQKNNTIFYDPTPEIYLGLLPVGSSRIYDTGNGVGTFTEGQLICWGQVSTASTLSNLQSTFTLYPSANYQ